MSMTHRTVVDAPAPPRRPSASARPWFRIEDKSDAPDEVDVYIFDEIGQDWFGDGISAKDFAQALDEIDAPVINLRINSPGGDVWEGVAIYNTLVRHPASVNVYVDGVAASAASFIAMAGDTITMCKGTQMMIHDPSCFVWGNAADMQQAIDMLDSISASIAQIYADRAGGTVKSWRQAMAAETWYTADEAVAAGLADKTAGTPAKTADDVAVSRPTNQAPTHQLVNTERKSIVSDDLSTALVAALGLDAGSTTDQVIEAVEALKASTSTDAPAPSAVVPEGTTVIDSGVLAELKNQAAAGVAAKAELDTQRRDAIIDKAKAEGRLTAVSAKVWRERLDADEDGTVALLDTLAQVVPVDEIGHSDDVDDDGLPHLTDLWAPDTKKDGE